MPARRCRRQNQGWRWFLRSWASTPASTGGLARGRPRRQARGQGGDLGVQVGVLVVRERGPAERGVPFGRRRHPVQRGAPAVVGPAGQHLAGAHEQPVVASRRLHPGARQLGIGTVDRVVVGVGDRGHHVRSQRGPLLGGPAHVHLHATRRLVEGEDRQRPEVRVGSHAGHALARGGELRRVVHAGQVGRLAVEAVDEPVGAQPERGGRHRHQAVAELLHDRVVGGHGDPEAARPARPHVGFDELGVLGAVPRGEHVLGGVEATGLVDLTDQHRRVAHLPGRVAVEGVAAGGAERLLGLAVEGEQLPGRVHRPAEQVGGDAVADELERPHVTQRGVELLRRLLHRARGTEPAPSSQVDDGQLRSAVDHWPHADRRSYGDRGRRRPARGATKHDRNGTGRRRPSCWST